MVIYSFFDAIKFDPKNLNNIEEIIKKSYLQKIILAESKVLEADNFLNII